MKLKVTENQIQKGILQWLSFCPYITAWRNNTGRAMLPGKNGKPMMVRFGVAGQADITGIVDGGRRLEIEVKSERGKQSEDQRAFQQTIENAGGIYILARSIEDVRIGLAKAGVNT